MLAGTRVTKQPRKWYDGTPVANWPDPNHVGEVVEMLDTAYASGQQYARVRYASGRVQIENIANLTEV